MSPTEEIARRKAIMHLAAEAETDVRTAAKAIDEGIAAIRGLALRARLGSAANRLGMALGASTKVRAT